MAKESIKSSHTITSLLMLLIGLVCLVQGVSKPLLWFGGARATGIISYQENTVSSRGAFWVRYKFTDRDGLQYSGTAMTASKNALYKTVQVAYLPALPDLNMPAYGGYTVLLSVVWSFSGIILLGLSRLFVNAGNNRKT